MNTKFCVCFRVWGRRWRRCRKKIKIWIFSPKMSKKNDRQTLRTHPTEDDGEIFADISDEKWWHCMFVQLKNNKIILCCTHTGGYFIYKHHMVGIVLKVNPQVHCCIQTQSIKHSHQKIFFKDVSCIQEEAKIC